MIVKTSTMMGYRCNSRTGGKIALVKSLIGVGLPIRCLVPDEESREVLIRAGIPGELIQVVAPGTSTFHALSLDRSAGHGSDIECAFMDEGGE